jgi:hypothetical protein
VGELRALLGREHLALLEELPDDAPLLALLDGENRRALGLDTGRSPKITPIIRSRWARISRASSASWARKPSSSTCHFARCAASSPR